MTTDDYLNYRSLWRAVLLQAIMDAMRDRPSDPTRERVEGWKARMWLDHPDMDFHTTCSNADVDPVRVQRWWKAYKKNPVPPKNVMEMMRHLGVYRVKGGGHDVSQAA